MKIEYDEAKNQKNIAKHELSFEIIIDFAWNEAIVENDARNYGEARFIASGFINQRLHIVIFTIRGDAMRIISLRKANKREVTKYERNTIH